MGVRFFHEPSRIVYPFILCIISLLQNAHAGTLLPIEVNNNNTWFVGVGAGGTWMHLNDHTTVLNGVPVAAPYNQDSFTIQNPDAGIGQINLGYRWQGAIYYLSAASIFVQYRHDFSTNIDGNITQFSLPEFRNYHYKMSDEAELITLNGKINFQPYKKFSPYLSAGIGFISNQLSDYEETPLPNVTPRTSPGYGGNSNNNLALTLGVGVDYSLSENYWLTFGYEHIFQGAANSGPGASTWSDTHLNFGNVKMDTLFINFTARLPQGFRR